MIIGNDSSICYTQVSRDGALQIFDVLSFGNIDPVPYSPGLLNDVGPTMVAPYWCDIGSDGEITFGMVQMGQDGADALLSKADDCVRQGFPLTAANFESTDLFVATWRDVRASGGGAEVL